MPTPRAPSSATTPLVYSCSGCSSVAQLANHVAVRLDREGLAEMSCIAGLGGDVPSLLRKARDAAAATRPIIAIDGCVLSCVGQTLARHGMAPTHHVALWRLGIRKRQHEDFSAAEAAEALAHCRQVAAQAAEAADAAQAASAAPAAPQPPG